MNEVLDAIRERRSVRAFKADPVEPDKVEAVLEAGRWAPSGKNTQPWRFIVVESPEKRGQLGQLVTQMDMVRTAPVTIAVLLDTRAGYDRTKDVQAIGACAQNMLLAAHALGLGTCWIGRVRDEQVERVLGAQEHEELMLLFPLGYPAESPQPKERRPLEELVRRA
ncbi:MAG: nitroreductase family protein [Candidatus Bipolaricaulaceae bacterium]